MSEWFLRLPPVWQSLAATLFTWGMTAAGAGLVFFFRSGGERLLNNMLGLSAGLMLAATFWSLLAPAAEMAAVLRLPVWLTLTIGFSCGCALIFFGNWLHSRAHSGQKRPMNGSLMFAAITLHNIPEGLAVGVAFGSLAYRLEGATLAAACLLALGIGLQNFPEGIAVSLPILREGASRRKAFFLGQISGMVEPVAGVFGALLVLSARMLLPYLLAFAAGAMLYVVVEEMIPESQNSASHEQAMFFTMLGFLIMTVMDVAL